MNNKRATKRALLTSVTALVMCVVMLVGTTFAWFTDTASTGVNKIQAGNLDIELAYKNAKTMKESATDSKFETVTTDTKVFDESALWEPGHVEFVVLKISNAGTLALKYKLGINIANETGSKSVVDNKDFNLSDYIKFAVIDNDQSALDRDALVAVAEQSESAAALKAGYTAENHLLAGATDSEKIVTLVVWMPTDVGNEANHAKDADVPTIELGISVAATQYTYEKDSFDETYDKNAQYPEVSYAQVSSQDDLNAALTNPTDANGNPTTKVTVDLKKNTTVTLDNGIANSSGSDNKARDITFVGDGTQTVNVATEVVGENNNKLNYQRGSTFTFENLTIQAGEGSFEGIVCDELTYKNCTIKGKLTLYGKATFINCVFENTMANQYSIWTWGGTDVTFEKCTFNTNGKAILLYGGAVASAPPTNLVVNKCTFNDRNNGNAGKAAIEIGNDYNATYTLTVNNATVNGFADGKNTGSKLWANKNSMDAAHLTVTIDGSKVH